VEVGGYRIPQGTSVHVDFAAIHRDPQHWQDAHQFDHTRFSKEVASGRFRHAFMPFSMGPRQCVAQRLSMVMLKVFTSSILRTHEVVSVDDDGSALQNAEWVYRMGVCQPRASLGVCLKAIQ
jgi:cytochrome P450